MLVLFACLPGACLFQTPWSRCSILPGASRSRKHLKQSWRTPKNPQHGFWKLRLKAAVAQAWERFLSFGKAPTCFNPCLPIPSILFLLLLAFLLPCALAWRWVTVACSWKHIYCVNTGAGEQPTTVTGARQQPARSPVH